MKSENGTPSFLGILKSEINPPDLPLFNETIMNIYGNRYIAVDGISGVVEYLSDGVLLRIKRGEIRVRGERLEIRGLSDRSISISGKITSVEFNENSAGAK